MKTEAEVPNQRLKEFFDWATRRSFWDLNVKDKKVTDYISSLLTNFARTENLYKIRDQRGRRLETIVEMLLEAQEVAHTDYDLLREREIRRHVGDYVLFMTGMFREYTNRLSITSYYLQEGSRAYWSVSEIDRALYHPEAVLFQELSTRFEFYVGGLNYLRSLFFRDRGDDDPFEGFTNQLRRLV
ncbi:MAG: hypothetical protein DRG50_01795 [Deltaproteobacteria bacterium]|nr:MAG: hypothetical protein DRG50_01795 [Deltaproteobacteria bacterium]